MPIVEDERIPPKGRVFGSDRTMENHLPRFLLCRIQPQREAERSRPTELAGSFANKCIVAAKLQPLSDLAWNRFVISRPLNLFEVELDRRLDRRGRARRRLCNPLFRLAPHACQFSF